MLAERQHGVVAREQMIALGFNPRAIEHRIAQGRLHPVFRGVYGVGRPQLTLHGRWLAAVLACGPEAVLSHESAAALLRIRPQRARQVEVSVPLAKPRRPPGIVVHRRAVLGPGQVTKHQCIPVTTPTCTLIDIATRVTRDELEAAVNEADKRDLAHPEQLRTALDEMPRLPGTRALRELLDRHTFVLTDSELERCFLRLVRRADLPEPVTGCYVNGFKVDFYWPDLGLVVETDGLRYHRTAAQQARDRIRDQTHTAAGLTTLRFTRAQVRFEPRRVQNTLEAVVRRLQAI
jgi:very-short-patch-repair endonuclease